MTGGRFSGLNQLTDTINGGRVRIAGHLTNKPGTVVAGTNAAVMDPEHTSFAVYTEVANGPNMIPVAPTAARGHSTALANPSKPGKSKPGHGIGRHRPCARKAEDSSLFDPFYSETTHFR